MICHKSKKLFLLCAFFILCASCNDNEQVKDQSMEIRQLDSLVANKLDFRIKRDRHIADLKKRLHSDDLDAEHQYIINGDIADNYFGYQSDSVITYLQKNLVLADSTENNNWRYETLIKKSNLLNSIGLFTESKMILDSIKTDVPKVLLFSYNSTSESLYTNLYEYSRSNKMFYLPYVFTEQGVAMASAILRTDIAVKVSVGIMEAFVEMRRMLISNAALFHRLDNIELKQLEADQKFEEIFKALESDKLHSEKGIFYNGQVFDAYAIVSDIIRIAKTSIILLDNYVDDTVLTLLGKRNAYVTATIYTKNISNQLRVDVQRYNSQYPPIEIEVFSDAQDRFLIIDGTELYHIGSTLKDLGKKWFAFSRMDIEVGRMLQILNNP